MHTWNTKIRRVFSRIYKHIKKLFNKDRTTEALVYIDAGNVWGVYKSKQRIIDWYKFKNYITSLCKSNHVNFYYYDCFPKEGTRDIPNEKHKFFAYLKKGLRFKIIKKKLKQVRSGSEILFEKGNMDVEMAMDMTYHIYHYKPKKIFLFSGDSDFLPLIKLAHSQSIKCYVLSSKNMVSHELHSEADEYIDITSIDEVWGPTLSHTQN